MNVQEVTKFIESTLAQSLDGQDIENLKVDCKSKWWDLKTLTGLNEFLKDTTAIVNTFGLDGFIIIGFDDKTGSFQDVKFTDCGLRDSQEIRNILIKHVEPAFDLNTFDIVIDYHKLSVLQIPSSVDKPHVLKVYKNEKRGNIVEEFNKIFIRKNSSNHVASKNDIDIMYYDRKNIIPEYKLIISVSKQSLTISGHGIGDVYQNMNLCPILTFENQGTRPIAIVDMQFKYSEHTDPQPFEEYVFKMVKTNPIIIPVNQIINITTSFEAIWDSPRSISKSRQVNANWQNLNVSDIELTTNAGQKISQKVLAY